VINEIVLGHAAMAIDWGDIGPHNYSDVSTVQGKIGYALPPGSKEYWDWRSNKWVKTDKTNKAPVHCFNGWSWYITSTTKHPDLCWSFIDFMLSPEISSIDVASPDSGFQPWRISHSKNLQSWIDNGWDKQDAVDYIQNTLDVTDHPNSVIDARVPGMSNYFEAIYEPYLVTILSGEKTAQEALDQVASYRDDGVELFSINKYQEAINAFNKVLNVYPQDGVALEYSHKAYLQHGISLFGKEDYLAARDQFKSCLRLKNDSQECQVYLEKSENLYKEVHYRKGIQLFDKELLTEAIDEWKLVRLIDPNYKRVDYLITKAKTILKNIQELKESQKE